MSTNFIGFSRPSKPSLLTRIAMWLDDANFSHAFLSYFDADWQCQMVIQLDEYGFRLIPAEQYEKKNTVMHLVHSPSNFDQAMAKVARQFAGTMYDFKGFLGMALVLLLRKIGIKKKNPLASSETMICTEMVARTLVECGYQLPPGSMLDSISPRELWEMLSSVGDAR